MFALRDVVCCCWSLSLVEGLEPCKESRFRGAGTKAEKPPSRASLRLGVLGLRQFTGLPGAQTSSPNSWSHAKRGVKLKPSRLSRNVLFCNES